MRRWSRLEPGSRCSWPTGSERFAPTPEDGHAGCCLNRRDLSPVGLCRTSRALTWRLPTSSGTETRAGLLVVRPGTGTRTGGGPGASGDSTRPDAVGLSRVDNPAGSGVRRQRSSRAEHRMTGRTWGEKTARKAPARAVTRRKQKGRVGDVGHLRRHKKCGQRGASRSGWERQQDQGTPPRTARPVPAPSRICHPVARSWWGCYLGVR
jgi:hypothetical protein